METQNDHRSEVARLREQIAQEHQAAEWAVTGLASGTAKHLFITRRMERIGDHQQRLASLIGEQASMQIVCSIFEGDPLPQSHQG
jgi:hypothetical protein